MQKRKRSPARSPAKALRSNASSVAADAPVASPSKIVSKDKRAADSKDAKRQKRIVFDDDDEVEAEAMEIERLVAEDLANEAARLRDARPEHGLRPDARKRWQRPPLPDIDQAHDAIVFQQLDMDYVTINEPLKGMPGIQKGSVAIIRMYGITEQGNSVFCKVHGFAPYFYMVAPPGFREDDLPLVVSVLNSKMADAVRTNAMRTEQFVVHAQLERKQSIMGFSESKANFIKIFTQLPGHVPTCRNMLMEGVTFGSYGHRSYECYEADLAFVLRFMIDKSIVGASWVRLPAGKWHYTAKPISKCQLEVDISCDELDSLGAEGEWGKLAPFRVLSFDIECASRKNAFPDAKLDPVIQIANIVKEHGSSKPMVRNVFNLGTCTNIVGAQVFTFAREKDLLVAWREFLEEVDADVLIGYNINNFDLPYLVDRSHALGCGPQFLTLGRLKGVESRVKDTKFSSKAYGTRESKETLMDGRVFFDILQVIQRDYKLRSYSLNAVAGEFLKEAKEDVHHSIISDLYHGSADDRRRLAVYCLKDAYLPLRLLDKLMIMYNYIEMARVTGVPVPYLLSRGQQIKVVSQLYRKAAEEDLVIPYYKKQEEAAGFGEDGYEGATVFEPVRGFHRNAISTLDFASLYPSIMMAHNLCYSTLLTREQAMTMEPDDYAQTPAGDYFCKESKRPGLLPRILRELLGARKKAKADLKKEKDPFKRAVLDGRQLALKISANSVYGFTGATIGKLPCLAISAGTTAYGREMIAQTKEIVEKHYSVENGRPATATVIYGDTDSVMIDFHTKSLEEAMQLGEEAAELVSKSFLNPIKLEFEKCYKPYLLINKKRYAGLLYTKPEKYDKIDMKGIETVRRDNCLLVKNLVNEALVKILVDEDLEGAKDLVKKCISDLLQNKLDLSLLVITKALSKEAKDYASKQAHTELAERMKKRDPSTAPAIGDRVPYVIIQGVKGAKAYEKAEDPLYVLENDLPLDADYYIEHHIKPPILRIFEPVMDNVSALLSGSHTTKISRPTPKSGGIVGFTIRRETCLGCKTLLNANEEGVCSACRPKVDEVYERYLVQANRLESKFSRVWTQCQNCQGSMHQTVICTSRDCPVYYQRMKIKKDLRDTMETLAKFNLKW